MSGRIHLQFHLHRPPCICTKDRARGRPPPQASPLRTCHRWGKQGGNEWAFYRKSALRRWPSAWWPERRRHWADFWSDAGAKFQGVTLHGVTESTPPSNYIKDVLAPEFEKETGIKVEIETTSWDQMYDKAIKDMEASTGIYDMVYIEQDIIYAYLARNFLVDITKSLKDDPSLKAPDFDETHFTTFANYFKNADGDLFGVPMEAFIKIYLYRTDLFNDPEDPGRLQGEDRQGPEAGDDPRGLYRRSPSSSPSTARRRASTSGAPPPRRHTGHPASWYEFFESIAPTFGVYNWGINAADNYGASVEHGGTMNSPEAKAALKYWLHLRDIAPPESAASTWTEVATTFAAGRAAQGLVYGENAAWIASDPEQVQGRRQGRRRAAAGRARRHGGRRGRQGLHRLLRRRRLRHPGHLEEQGGRAALPAVHRPGLGAGPAGPSPRSRITNTATYDDPAVMRMDKKLGGYYTMLRDQGKLFAGAPPYPFHAQVSQATTPIFFDILTGAIEPDAGLDQMAAKAEEELTNLGYRK